MLTRTVISPSTIEEIRRNPSTGKHMINYLIDDGLLLVNEDQLDHMARHLPVVIWKKLEKEIINKRLAKSPWIPSMESVQPEVVITESGIDGIMGAISSAVDDYRESPPVAFRRQIKSGEKQCNDRDELWKWVIEPIITSLPLRNRQIDIIDPYVFHPIHRAATNNKRDPAVADMGLFWLLERLRDSTKNKSSMSVNVYTRETSPKNNPLVDLARVKELSDSYISPLSHETFHVNIRVCRYLREPGRELEDAFHGRRIFLNQSRMLVLDKGLEDLTKMKRGERFGDRAGEAITFLPHAYHLYAQKFVGIIQDQCFDRLWKDYPEFILSF